jgi:hypothetical protein
MMPGWVQDVTPLATPYRATIQADYNVFRAAFDKFWEENGEFLVKHFNYKGKKLKGGTIDLSVAKDHLEQTLGVNKIYKGRIAEIAADLLDDPSEGKTVLLVDAVNLHSFNPEAANYLTMLFYYWPKVTYTGEDFDYNFTRKAPRDLEQAFVQRCQDIRQKNSYLVPSETAAINEESSVLIDIITKDESTTKVNFRTVVKFIADESIRGKIIGLEKGAAIEAPNEDTILVKINDVNTVKYFDVDDDNLYIKEGSITKEKFKEKFTKEYNEYFDRADRAISFDSVLNQIVESCEMESIPQKWIDVNAESAVEENLQRVADKKKLFSYFGVKTEDELLKHFSSQVMKETITQMCMRCYAHKVGVESTREAVSDHIMSKAIWSDPQENSPT